jgi:hypothetical protein
MSFTPYCHYGGQVKRIRSAGQAECIRETRNTYKILTGEREVQSSLKTYYPSRRDNITV